MIENDPRIDPAALRTVKFPGSSRKYDGRAVDEFLRNVSDRVAATNALVDDLSRRLRVAEQTKPAPSRAAVDLSTLSDDELLQLVGEETAAVLGSARKAAAEIRTKAEEAAGRVIRESTATARTIVEEAESAAADLHDEASNARTIAFEAAERDAERLRQDATREATTTVAEAREAAHAELASVESRKAAAQDEAAQTLVEAREEGRAMVGEAKEVRAKIMDDLQRRRDAARTQIERLIDGRDRLLEAYAVVQSTLDDATRHLHDAAPGATSPDGADLATADDSDDVGAAVGLPGGLVDAGVSADDGPFDVMRESTVGFEDDGPLEIDAEVAALEVVEVPDEDDDTVPSTTSSDDVADVPDADVPDADVPDADVPDAGIVVAGIADGGIPDGDAPDSDAPDSDARDSDAPERADLDGDAPAAGVTETDGPEVAVADLAPVDDDAAVADEPAEDAGPSAAVDDESRVTEARASEQDVTEPPVIDLVEDTSAESVSEHQSGPDPEADMTLDVTGDAGPGEEDGSGDGVDALFARLRAERAESVSKAQLVLEEVGAAEETRAESGKTAVLSDVSARDEVVDRALLAPADALVRRSEAIGAVEAGLIRAVKRRLADEQNVVLDLVRRGEASDVDALYGSHADHLISYRDVITAALGQVADVAATSAGGAGSPEVAPLSGALAMALVDPLRRRVERAIESVDGDPDALDDRLRALYREWKAQRIAPVVEDALLSAYAAGTVAGTDAGQLLRWTVDPEQGPCPDAMDNALAGGTVVGEVYPTGDPCPQAHPGCRCLLVSD